MGIFGKKDENVAAEERLEVLNNRLVSATYEEDKIETLEDIYNYAATIPVAVGTICLSTVFQTLEDTENPELPLRIIRAVTAAGHKAEFTEMLFEDKQNVDILYSLDVQVVVKLSDILGSKYYFGRISSHEKAPELVKRLVEANFEDCANNFIIENRILKDKLIFYGMLEILLEKHRKCRNKPKIKKAVERLLCLLLEDSPIAQNYMFENKLCLTLLLDGSASDDCVLSIFIQLLDPYNTNFRDIQAALFIPRQIHRAIEQKNYEYLYRLTLDNLGNMRYLLQDYLNIDILVEDSETILPALLIFSAYVEYDLPKSIYSKSYKINIILEEHGIGQPLQHNVLNDLNTGMISPELLLYILFVFDSIDQVEERLKNIEMDGICDTLRIILLFTHCKTIVSGSDHYSVIKKLKMLRACLCSSVLINDHFDGILISNITDIIEELSEVRNNTIKSIEWPKVIKDGKIGPGAEIAPSKHASLDKVGSGFVDGSEPLSTGFSERFTSIVGSGGYKKIADKFRIFKKDESDVYDL